MIELRLQTPRAPVEDGRSGTRRHPVRRVDIEPPLSGRWRPRRRKNHAFAAVPLGRRQGWREMPLYHPFGNQRGTNLRRGIAWLVARRHRNRRTRRRSERPGRRIPGDDVPPLGDGTERNDRQGAGRGRTHESRPRGFRFALGTAAAGAKFSALSPTDSGPETVLRRTELHGPAARRPDLRRLRLAASKYCPRRHLARAARADLWGRASPVAGVEVSGHQFSRRIS